MNWFFTAGNGRSVAAGNRPGADSANGNAVMYDARAGKILTVGGAQAFSRPEFAATGTTVIITIQGVGMSAQTQVVGSLNMPRVYANALVLPDGKVAVVGGSAVPKEFSDETPIMNPGVPLVCTLDTNAQLLCCWKVLVVRTAPRARWSPSLHTTRDGNVQRSGTHRQRTGRSSARSTQCPARTTPQPSSCATAAFCTAAAASAEPAT